MLKKKTNINFISEVTGLSKKEILKIKNTKLDKNYLKFKTQYMEISHQQLIYRKFTSIESLPQS